MHEDKIPVRTTPQYGRDGRVRCVQIITDVLHLLEVKSPEELEPLNDLLKRVAEESKDMVAVQIMAYVRLSANYRRYLSHWKPLRSILITKLTEEQADVKNEMAGLWIEGDENEHRAN